MTLLHRLNLLKMFTITLAALCAISSQAQTINQNWRQELNSSLQKFLTCAVSKETPCVNFTGESLNTVYKINDFYSQASRRYMTTNEIANFLKNSDKWEALGQSYDQKTLSTAQEMANAKKAVVAVYQNAVGVGHVVLITPGELKPSGSWGLSVPTAASFFTVEPEKSFVDKGLSFAFMKPMLKDVHIYARKYN